MLHYYYNVWKMGGSPAAVAWLEAWRTPQAKSARRHARMVAEEAEWAACTQRTRGVMVAVAAPP